MKETVDFTSFARCFVLVMFVIFSTPCWAQSAYFTGDGGKGIRLAVLEPTGKGLSAQIQGETALRYWPPIYPAETSGMMPGTI